VRNLKKRLKTQNQNGPIYLPHGDFSKQIHDLRDIWVSFRDKFQMAEINSDAQTVHSFYKYMRKIRARDKRIGEEDSNIFSFVYYIFCKLFFLFLFKWSNGWLESLGEWTNIFKEEYGIPGCLTTFVL
jgi:hypothetical protein